MRRLVPRHWARFQHYKNRRPPWIKIHHDLLNDREFMSLPIASKALAPLLWLLASESEDGVFDADTKELVFRLHPTSRSDVDKGVSGLIAAGLFVDASTPLAECAQGACLETETETETETEKSKKRAPARPDDVPEQVWSDWLSHRRAKKAPATATALVGIRREAKKAGLSLTAALEMSITQGWQGFKAEWLKTRTNGRPRDSAPNLTDTDFSETKHGGRIGT